MLMVVGATSKRWVRREVALTFLEQVISKLCKIRGFYTYTQRPLNSSKQETLSHFRNIIYPGMEGMEWACGCGLQREGVA